MKTRQVYLDNIKVFLISYVITGHIAASYGAIGGGKWNYLEPVQDVATRGVLSLYVLVAYSFLMGMFIFIAGYFTVNSLKKKGTSQFIKDRLMRLATPLVFYYFVIGPLVKYISRSAQGYDGSLWKFLGESYSSGVYGFLGVMWFVVLILFFSVVYAFFDKEFPKGWYRPKGPAFPNHFRVLIFVLSVGLLSFLSRMVFPLGSDMVGSRPLSSMVFFGTAFFLGTTAARYSWVENLHWPQAKPWAYSAVVAMLVPVVLFMFLKTDLNFALVSHPATWASLSYAFWEVIKTLGTGMMAILFFRKYLNKPGKLSTALGQSVFVAYFIHPLICVIFLSYFSHSGMHPLIKFAVVAPVSLFTTFLIAWLLRLVPWIRAVV